MPEPDKYTLAADIPDAQLEAYLAQDIVAVDSELQGLKMWRDQVCLVQISDKDRNVCMVKIKAPKLPPNLSKLLTDPSTTKIFHYAVADVAFMRSSLNVAVHPYRCTKVMSKLVRTYTDSHNLKALVRELVGVELEKQEQSSDWSREELSQEQLKYAASDVVYLVDVYNRLDKMIADRGKLPTGITLKELNENCQACLPNLVDILLNGYGDKDRGWETTLFLH